MKPNHDAEPDAALDGTMRQWRVDTPLPPRFQEQVWQRIARVEAGPDSTPQGSLVRWFELVLPRPKVAAAYVALLAALGMAAGSWTAQIQSHRVEAALGARYVHSLAHFQTDASEP